MGGAPSPRAMPGEPDFAPSPPIALYVHVPFCLSICPYCDFVVYPAAAARGPRARIETFVGGLEAEIALRAAAVASRFGDVRRPLASVYIGGGTPSLLDPRHVARLLAAAQSGFGLAADAEVTIEANPGPADRGDLAGFRSAGVTRLSIGAQSLVGPELRRLGRRHSAADVGETISLARRAGYRNIGLDLLYDVPGQTLGSWRQSLAAVLALEPDHLSAYALTLDDPDAEGLSGRDGDHLPLRPGARRWRARAAAEQDADRSAAMYELADRFLARAGLAWYELANWSRPGAESRHNLVYWHRRSYEAVGPGAHAFDGGLTRRWNAAHLDSYVAALTLPGAPRLPPGGSESLDHAAATAELAILRLRTRAGLPAAWAHATGLGPGLAWGRANRLLTASGGRVRLTLTGRLLANELFMRLLPERAAAA